MVLPFPSAVTQRPLGEAERFVWALAVSLSAWKHLLPHKACFHLIWCRTRSQGRSCCYLTNGQNADKTRGRAGSGASHSSFSWFPFGLGRLKNSCWVINSAAGAESCQPVAGRVRFGALRPELQQDLGWKGPREVCGVSTGCSRGFTELGSGSPQGWRACNCFSSTQLEKFSSHPI